VSDRQYRDVTFESNEYDVIRKVVNRKATDVAVDDARNEGSCFGKLLQVQKRLSDFSGESVRYLTAPFAVPVRGFTQLATCAFA
jgi:hypothetical protein